MEAAPTEASFPLSPGGSSQSSGREKEDAAPASTSSTAREVEEELLLPTSTSLASEEDTVLPRSTSFAGQEDLPDTSLPPSSESPDPQGPSPSEPSSAPLESSPFAFSSPSPSPSTSPLSWKASSDGLQQLLEEEEEGRGEQAGAGAGAWLSPGGRAEQKKAKKKAPPVKKGAPGYTVRAIVPAEKEELVSVARAMHREKFAKNVKELFHLEKEAALKSIQTGLYIGWRCPEYLWDCFRVGDESRCFCGHLLKLHQVYVEKRATVPCTVADCKCQGFVFIPSCPEEVGEFWLRRRTGFDVAAWRAKCQCKHTHEEHMPIGARGCCVRGCSCAVFASSFLCAACDRRWEEHETFFESEETRRKGGRPCGESYLPFAELPKLREAVLTGCCEDPSASWALPGQACQALPAPSGSRALPLPPPGPRRLLQKDDKKA
ncbi:protein FAM221B isoform 4-T4 [Liasis olivaceus]